jgi:hypothetical protein
MIMLQAIACSHGVEPVKNGTALTSTKATLRAQVYSATLRTSLAVLKAAAIENPRLITALTAVISAQKRNGMLIQDANGVDAPSQNIASSDYQVENSVATSDVGTLEHPSMCAKLCSRLSALRAVPEAMCDEVCIMLFLVASMPRSERLPNRQTRNDQRFTTDLTWTFLLARRRSMPLCIVALTFRHARTARMRWERVAFLKAPKSGARRDNSVVSAGVLRSVSVNPKNSAMRADEEIPASIM